MNEEEIKKIIDRMHTIRGNVNINPLLSKSYFSEWYELTTNLRILDKNNPELDISIHNKPFGGI